MSDPEHGGIGYQFDGYEPGQCDERALWGLLSMVEGLSPPFPNVRKAWVEESADGLYGHIIAKTFDGELLIIHATIHEPIRADDEETT